MPTYFSSERLLWPDRDLGSHIWLVRGVFLRPLSAPLAKRRFLAHDRSTRCSASLAEPGDQWLRPFGYVRSPRDCVARGSLGTPRWLNGEPVPSARRRIDEKQLSAHLIDLDDLQENLRLAGGTDDVSRVASAIFERNGAISVRLRPAVYEVASASDRRTLRIEIE
jgi:hypothetical protein